MIRINLPRLIAGVILSVAFAAPSALYAQTPAGLPSPATPTEVEKMDARVAQVITQAETRFKEGELHLRAGKRKQAREKFDRAVDTVLESGLDVRASQKLQTYYLELVERIFRLESPQQEDVEAGFKRQKFEPSPLEVYGKLVVSPEGKKVNSADLAGLGVAKTPSTSRLRRSR